MNFSKGMISDFRRALRTKGFEKSDNGIYITASKLDIGGEMSNQLLFGPSFKERGSDRMVGQNLIVSQGLILAIIDVLANGTQVAQWYLAPFKNNATPQSTWTGTNVAANSGEFLNYTEATRPAFVFPDPTTIITPSISNSASLAVTTIDAGADKTLWGGSVVANATKGDATAGVPLFASVKFPAARSGLQTGDGIGWAYQLAAASA